MQLWLLILSLLSGISLTLIMTSPGQQWHNFGFAASWFVFFLVCCCSATFLVRRYLSYQRGWAKLCRDLHIATVNLEIAQASTAPGARGSLPMDMAAASTPGQRKSVRRRVRASLCA